MKKFNRFRTITLLLFPLVYACKSNAQQEKILFTDTILRYSVTQADLDKYIAFKKINDTIGKSQGYLEIVKSVVIRHRAPYRYNGIKPSYAEEVNIVEAFIKRKNMVNKVLVVKNERKMYLLKDQKIIKTYPIALGPNPVGQKEYEGDGRTPEGTYTLDWQKWNSSTFHSYHISYPNKIDSARAKAKGLKVGSNIMVHGTSKGLKKRKDWTNGCIALSNKDMLDFRSTVFQDTQIEIRR